jgi:putative ATPase
MTAQPLADRLRPHTLADYFGQEKLTGSNGVIRRLLAQNKNSGFFPSLIFWGPPGCGKTTLARIIARELEREFFEFSAVNTSVKDIEKILPQRTGSQRLFQPPVVFLDEIHRFNKSQQDALLPHVEQGNMLFLGATTENPSFSVIGPLLSRCRVVLLEPLGDDSLAAIIDRAIPILNPSATLTPDARTFLVQAAGGDARVALTTIEIAYHLLPEPTAPITPAMVAEALQRRQLTFDKNGEEFYNTISALHKSIRGSDPNASLYWLTRMLESGQDPIYISRRLIRLASEDIGLLDPHALSLAVAAHQACKEIGMPECNLALAECVAYLARAPKSNDLYTAYTKAAEDVHTHGNLPVPLHIRNASTKLMKALDYGKGYRYEHSREGKKNEAVTYLPEPIANHVYLAPVEDEV